MRKKKTVADEAKKQEEMRRSIIRDFNANNFGELWIDAEKVPTEDDINNAKKEFEERTSALQEKTYLIADAPNAVRVATFLKNFLKTCFWVQNSWRGVLNLNGLLSDFLEDVEKNGPKDLIMDYGAMQFTYYVLENYAGIGLEAADAFARQSDEYIPIYDSIRDHIEWFNAENKYCEKLRDRWSMFAQGYYLVILEHDEAVPFEPTEDSTESAENCDSSTKC